MNEIRTAYVRSKPSDRDLLCHVSFVPDPPRTHLSTSFSGQHMVVRMRRGAQNDSANAHERRATNSSSSVVVVVIRRRLSFLVSGPMSFRIPCHFGVVFSEKYRSGVIKDRSRFKVWSKQIF